MFGFAFDNVNRLTSLSRPGSTTVLAFDDRNFVTSIVHSRPGATLASFNYVMDNIGNRTQMTTQAGNFDYSYDVNNQVTSATNPEAAAGNNPSRSPSSFSAETFNYDQIYNRTSDQGGGYTYDNKAQRLTEDYRNFYFYDNNGNLLSKQQKGLNGPSTNFEYSSENQLRAFKVFDPAYSNSNPVKEVTYIYDAVGRRIAKRVVDHQDNARSFERRYAYDGQEILLEYDESNTVIARYTHSGLKTDDVLAVDARSPKIAQNTGSYFYHKDALGTVTDVTDSAGVKVQHYVYSAFGVLLGIQDAQASDVTANAPLKTSYTFTGREFDSESGYYYYRARYYDAYIGRFLQKDPHPGKLSLSVSVVNSYAYAGNNGVMNTDPSGMFFGVGKLLSGMRDVMSRFLGNIGTAIYSPNLWILGKEGDFLQAHPALDKAATVAAIAFAAAYTGGAAAGALGLGGTLGGVAVGAGVGATIGAAGFHFTGVGPWWQGALIGALAGGFAGYSVGSGGCGGSTVYAMGGPPAALKVIRMTIQGVAGASLGSAASGNFLGTPLNQGEDQIIRENIEQQSNPSLDSPNSTPSDPGDYYNNGDSGSCAA